MALTAGARIREYEIVSSLGAGGMGEVYRARDTHLNRDVAIKILPELPVVEPERIARFEREAQTLASLNHPNIAQIHGIVELPPPLSALTGERERHAFAIVMELVEGEDLAARLRRGALPLDEALPIARQIAEALEAAHERGVIHRDLKPANVKVLDDGTVKLLDFGLAKAIEPAAASPLSATNAPTFTSPAVTNIGVIIGTAAYMAPEQAKGKPVDRRADIWALGVLLFELLSGKRLYEGETVTETIAQVITQPPNWALLPSSTPDPIRRILRRSLEKDPRNRFHAAGDVRLEIDEYLSSAAGEGQTPAHSRSRIARIAPWAIAGTLAALLPLSLWRPWQTPLSSTPPMRLEVRLDGGELQVNSDNDGALAVISPDGQTLVYAGTRDGVRRLYVRPLSSLSSTALSGTENAGSHFFSPDGRWVAFFSQGMLRKVAVTGGAPVVIAPAPEGRGGTWGPDDTIVFAPSIATGLYRVSASGGTPVELTTPSSPERSHRWPSILPDGNTVLFVRQNHGSAYDDGFIEAVRLDTKQRKVLVRGGTFPRYLTSGHLTYVRETTLFAVPFDTKRGEITGNPHPILSGVVSSGGVGAGFGDGASQIAFASNGTAAYIAGSSLDVRSRVVVVNRSGKRLFAFPEQREFRDPRFSPDGKRVALQMPDDRRYHVYVLDLGRATMTKVTFDGASNGLPVWSPDGQQLAHFSDRMGGGLNIFLTRSDGAGEPEPLTTGTATLLPNSFSPDGKLIAGMTQPSASVFDLFILSIADRRMTPFAVTPAAEMMPAFSPNGKWIAYQSDESGSAEVYVRPYPGPGGKWQISAGGGVMPRWTKAGRELVYLAGDRFMAVQLTFDGAALTPSAAQFLFNMPVARPTGATWFDVSSDGERFVVLEADDDKAQKFGFTHVTLALNFDDDVRRAIAK